MHTHTHTERERVFLFFFSFLKVLLQMEMKIQYYMIRDCIVNVNQYKGISDVILINISDLVEGVY